MAIKRAGPFATTTNPYADAPETPEIFGPVPVNCNKHQSATWPWRAVVRENVDPAYISTGAINITAPEVITPSINDTEDHTSNLQLSFAYQATEEWSFDGSTYEATAELQTSQEPEENPSVFISISINGIGVFEDDDIGTSPASISGSIDGVVFPAATVPAIVQITIGASSLAATGGSASASISLPLAEN